MTRHQSGQFTGTNPAKNWPAKSSGVSWERVRGETTARGEQPSGTRRRKKKEEMEAERVDGRERARRKETNFIHDP